MSLIWKDLWKRRVPQGIGLYLGISWAVVEFVGFIANQYVLSPHIVTLCLVLLASLLPSVFLVAYFHGAPGRQGWTRTEKTVIPINLVASGLLLAVVFSGKELGAATTTVVVEDEAGNEIERVVPKDEFRKAVALFTPATDSTDSATTWLGTAVLIGLMNDLYQDLFVTVRPWFLFRDGLREAGYSSDAPAPRSLKRSLARDMQVPLFVDGGIERLAEGFRLTLQLHDTYRGGAVLERVHEGNDLFALVDSAAIQLRRDLELPSGHLEKTQDLPVAEHTTSSMVAFRHYAEGVDAMLVRNDYPVAASAMEAALEADPTFADAAVSLYRVRVLTGDVARGAAALERAMENLHRLPERLHFMVKGEWYALQQDLQKSFAVYEMWAELYPQDIDALTYAAQVRIIQDDRRGAIEAYEAILQLDPTRLDLLPVIGSLYEAMGEPDEAQAYYERRVEATPEDETSLTALGRLHRRAGEHDRARELLERAELLNPGDVTISLALAALDRDLGDFDAALRRIERTLDRARTAEQRYAALSALSTYHSARGAMATSLEFAERAWEAGASFMPPLSLLQTRLLELDAYVHAGRADEALERLDSLAAQILPPQDAVVPIGKMALYGALGRLDDLEVALDEGRAVLERTGMNVLQKSVIYYGGRLEEMRGNWRAAIAAYEREREQNPTDATVPARLGRCYRESGDLERAEGLIRETLRIIPSHGRSHYELALVYERMGRLEEARTHLREALETWSPADEGFQLTQRARTALARLTGIGT